MPPTPKHLLLQNFLDWAHARADVRAAALVGSAARVDHPADEWSDYDVVVVADDPQAYLTSTDWLNAVGRPWCGFLERAPDGQPVERRVLFEGGYDIDFIFVSTASARQGFADAPMLVEISQRGRKTLWDPDGLLPEIPPAPASATAPASLPASPPEAAEFLEVVNDFWFHVAWTAKKLRRGELWMAKRCCDGYLKELLLRMAAWEAQSQQGWALNTWFGGRFFDQWALPQTRAELREAYATYDAAEVWRALGATAAIFERAAQATAAQLSYPYPAEAARAVRAWAAELRPPEE